MVSTLRGPGIPFGGLTALSCDTGSQWLPLCVYWQEDERRDAPAGCRQPAPLQGNHGTSNIKLSTELHGCCEVQAHQVEMCAGQAVRMITPLLVAGGHHSRCEGGTEREAAQSVRRHGLRRMSSRHSSQTLANVHDESLCTRQASIIRNVKAELSAKLRSQCEDTG